MTYKYQKPHSAKQTILRWFVITILLVFTATAGTWIWSGRLKGPVIQIQQPEQFIGQQTQLEVVLDTPAGNFSRISIVLEQDGKTLPVFTLEDLTDAEISQSTPNQISIIRQIGSRVISDLASGQARLIVQASRPTLYGLREAEATLTRELTVRLEPPNLWGLSKLHYINHGGSELAIYRVIPNDTESGVQVGNRQFPSFPASSVGITDDPATRVALFTLSFDFDLHTPINLYARDPAGNEVLTPLGHRAFPKPFANSQIRINERFLQRVIPAIVSRTPDLQVPANNLLAAYLSINRDLRQSNNNTIAALAKKSAQEMLWTGPFQQLGNSQVESRFADHRTYIYDGQEVDQQVHLGFDLAVTANVPILAAQRGTVLFSGYLGIYGNCVILDHGLGVQSLYGHLSTLEVSPGLLVEKGQELGRSGMTGLAGGDHLHFTMLVDGTPVNPLEWWDQKWMNDRIFLKIRNAGGLPPIEH